ncbi:hypothetical protein U0070_010034 [Myodes glareolus]|uniref:Uncharacterized protein n=1 Tax=Myodes glareolus TaxID=447135 RepID=A0AAW0I2I7_MYOGA
MSMQLSGDHDSHISVAFSSLLFLIKKESHVRDKPDRNISLKNIVWKMSKGWPPSDATEETRGLLAGKELLHQGNRE